MRLARHFRLSWLQVILSFINYGFLGILYVNFFKNHLGFSQLFLAEGLSAAAVVIFIFQRRAYRASHDIVLGFASIAFSITFLFLPFSPVVFYLFIIFRGLGSIIFYVPFNILYFDQRLEKRNLSSMTWYWALGLVPSVVAPVLGGFLYTYFGMGVFLSTSLVIVLFGIYCGTLVSKQKYPVSLRDLTLKLKGLRAINIVDGALHRVTNAIFIFALLYIHTEINYGTFLSIAAVVALFFAMKMARVSDTSNQRMRYLWPLCLTSGFICFAFIFARSASVFLTLAIALRSLAVFVEPLRSNIILDTREKDPINWVSREFYLNIGRVGLLFVLAALMRFNLIIPAFVFLGALHIIFPFMVHYKKVYYIDPKLAVLGNE